MRWRQRISLPRPIPILSPSSLAPCVSLSLRPLARARAWVSHRSGRPLSPLSAPSTPPRRVWCPHWRRRAPEPCFTLVTVVFHLRPPASRRQFVGSSASSSSLSLPSTPQWDPECFPHLPLSFLRSSPVVIEPSSGRRRGSSSLPSDLPQPFPMPLLDGVEPGLHPSALRFLVWGLQRNLEQLRRGSAVDLVAAGEIPVGPTWRGH